MVNAVEGFFAKLTRQRLKRGVFRSVIDLQVAINRFVAETNLNQTLRLDRRPKTRARRCQTGEANVRVSPLEVLQLTITPLIRLTPLTR
jgi:hypothetical protein